MAHSVLWEPIYSLNEAKYPSASTFGALPVSRPEMTVHAIRTCDGGVVVARSQLPDNKLGIVVANRRDNIIVHLIDDLQLWELISIVAHTVSMGIIGVEEIDVTGKEELWRKSWLGGS